MLAYTPSQFLELLKTIHCMSLSEFEAVFPDLTPGDTVLFSADYLNMKRDIFSWAVKLEQFKLDKICDAAAKKMVLYELTR